VPRAYRGVEYLVGFAGLGFGVIRFMGSAAGDLLGIFGEGELWGGGPFSARDGWSHGGSIATAGPEFRSYGSRLGESVI
jgi:hypothetical protein